MVHPRLKRITRKADPDSEPGDPDESKSDAEQEHEAESPGSKMDISDEGADIDRDEALSDQDDLDPQPHPGPEGDASSDTQKPISPMNSPSIKGSTPVFTVDDDIPESSVRDETPPRASRSQSLQSAKEAATRSPSNRRRLKITLKLPRAPSDDTEGNSSNISKPRGRGGGRGRGGRGRGKGKAKPKENPVLTFTLPARSTRAAASEPSVSSQASRSRSRSSQRSSPESEDDADVEADPDVNADDGMDVDQAAQDNDVEIESEDGDGDGDDDDDDVADDDSEVGLGDSKARLTARQAVLASMVGAEHVELGSGGPSRKKQLTSEELALRREETARKRKNMNEKKLEDEKTETINRLLKKQSSRSRAKRIALNSSVVPTPQSPHSGDENENDSDTVPVTIPITSDPKIRVMPGPAWRWISTQEGFLLGIPQEVTPLVASSPVGTSPKADKKPPAPAICDVNGCKEKRKYRLVSDFEKGACGMPHLKLLGAEA